MTSNYPTTLADKHNFYLTVDASHPLNERTLYWLSLHLRGSLQQYNVSLLRQETFLEKINDFLRIDSCLGISI